MAGVGVLAEGPLHAGLKGCYVRAGDHEEAPLDGYVVDILRNDLVIEIQTGSLAKVARKLAELVERHRARLVHPVITERVIVRVDAQGAVLSRRRSPRRGGLEDVFAELVACPTVLAHPSFSLDVVSVRTEEVRRFEAYRAWRRKGWVVTERRLLDVVGAVALDAPDDLRGLVPDRTPVP